MPRITRQRTIFAPPSEVWDLISDPYNLPRWWPRVARVESVDRKPEGKRSHVEGERYVWEQQLAGTPFERHLRRSVVEIGLQADGEGGTEVSLSSEQKLRGMSRLGSPMMRGGQGKILSQALDGIERALGGTE